MALVTPYLFPNQICPNPGSPNDPGYLSFTLEKAMEIMWKHGKYRIIGAGTVIEQGAFTYTFTDNYNIVAGQKQAMREFVCSDRFATVVGVFTSSYVSNNPDDPSGTLPFTIAISWGSPVYAGPLVRWIADVTAVASTVQFYGSDVVGACNFMGLSLPIYADSQKCPNYSLSVFPEEFNDPN